VGANDSTADFFCLKKKVFGKRKVRLAASKQFFAKHKGILLD